MSFEFIIAHDFFYWVQTLLKIHLVFTLFKFILTLNAKSLQLNVINVTYSRLYKNFYAECSVLLDKSLIGGGQSAIIAIKKIGNL